MIVIKKLEFSNVLSYGANNSVEFVGNRVTQIVGDNGAGKSSIPTILEEVFYNKNSRGIKKKDLQNRYLSGVKGYEIVATFEKADSEFVIKKTVGSSAKVVLTENGEDISGHTATQTYSMIEQIIGLDFPTFSKLVYQSMVSSLDFLSATDANRKKFLVSLLGLEPYLEIEKQLKDYHKESKLELASVEGSIKTLTSMLASVATIPSPVKEVEEPEVDEGLQAKINELESRKLSLARDNAEAFKNQRAKQELDAFMQRSVPVEVDHVDPMPKRLSIQRAEVELTQASKEVTKLLAVKDHCPTCGTKLDTGISPEAIKEATDRVELLKSEVERLTLELNPILEQNRLNAVFTKYKTDEALVTRNYDSSKPTETTDTSKLESEISSLTREYTLQKDVRASAIAQNRRAVEVNASIKHKTDQHNKITKDLREKEEQLSSAKSLVSKLEVLVGAFGNKGLIAYKIESMVKVFEELINNYLQVLADGRFVLGFSVEESKLTLKLYDSGEEVDIKSLSSGEFNKVNTATLLAVRKMLTAVSKVDINVLFLDEVVSVLDQEGKDTLIEVLLREENLNSMVVSHGYTHPLAETLKVVKVDKVSKIT